MGGSGWVELIELWIKKPVIFSELNKWVLVNRDVGQVGLTPTFHMIKKKKKNIYLPFGKLCNKLFNVKCITLNSLFILRMNSIKLINTYSIILKL